MYTNKNYEAYETLRRKTDEEYRSMAEELGISGASMMILLTLYSLKRPCTQKEVCDDWFENKQTINSAAKKLAAEGTIEILHSKENNREKLLVFTEKGRKIAEETAGKLIMAEVNAFGLLTEEEQKEAVRLSRKFYDFLKTEFEKITGEPKK